MRKDRKNGTSSVNYMTEIQELAVFLLKERA